MKLKKVGLYDHTADVVAHAYNPRRQKSQVEDKKSLHNSISASKLSMCLSYMGGIVRKIMVEDRP
jgi:hypothetical protein